MGEKKRRTAAAASNGADPRPLISHALELMHAGRLSEAWEQCRPLISAPLADAEALHVLGYLAIELNQPQSALTPLRRATQLQPAVAYYHNTLAIALRRVGRIGECIDAFRQALAVQPSLHEVHNNLGNALAAVGRHAEAASSYRCAMKLMPNIGRYWSAFAESIGRAALPPDETLHDDLLAALHHPEVDPKRLVRPVLVLCKRGPLQELFRNSGSGEALTPQRLFSADARAAFQNPLLLRLLETTLVDDLDFERLFTQVRSALLQQLSSAHALGLSLEFTCALARQCFTTEYAWWESAAERDLIDALAQRLPNEPGKPPGEYEEALALLAAYRPLSAFPALAPPDDDQGKSPLAALVRQQIGELAEEHMLQSHIVSVHPIEHEVSRAVKALYEANPYPRWVRLGRFDHARQLEEVLQELFPLKRLVRAGSGPLNVLIAGCGTGTHSIRSALRFSDARVLGIDISRASLAHALRKTREFSDLKVDYAQCDLLRVTELNRAFELVESVGVLHHLSDPIAGWRALLKVLAPGGFMRIGLYSELARRHIVRAQGVAQEHISAATPQEIRVMRQALLASTGEVPGLDSVVRCSDFYSASGCRDLLLHVQEHRFTLPQLGAALRDLGLEFLGFELPAPEVGARYLARFPSNPAMDNLENWHAFEQSEPDTFFGMYQFWVRPLVPSDKS
jgi:SAM-dependent methyltransferase